MVSSFLLKAVILFKCNIYDSVSICFGAHLDMAKVKKSKRTEKKNCCVKLKRLSRDTIERSIDSNNITYNVDAKIHRNKMNIGKTTITSNGGGFDIDVKISMKGISLSQSKIGTNQSFEPTSAPQVCSRILRSGLQTKVATTTKSDLKPNHQLCVAKVEPKGELVHAKNNNNPHVAGTNVKKRIGINILLRSMMLS